MVKPKRTALEKIQTLETKKVARYFFEYTTPSRVTEALHKEAWQRCKERNKEGFVMSYINKCLKEWQNEGFIKKSPVKIQFPVYKKKGKSYFLKNYGYRFNLEPLCLYCKEKHKIIFSQEEKAWLNEVLRFGRKDILKDYPNDNIIEATIKFYLKKYGIPNIEILNEQDRKVIEYFERIVEINLKKQSKEQYKKLLVTLDKDIKDSVARDFLKRFLDKKNKLKPKVIRDKSEQEKIEKYLDLYLYVINYKKNPELVSGINNKLKKVLGIA